MYFLEFLRNSETPPISLDGQIFSDKEILDLARPPFWAENSEEENKCYEKINIL